MYIGSVLGNRSLLLRSRASPRSVLDVLGGVRGRPTRVEGQAGHDVHRAEEAA